MNWKAYHKGVRAAQGLGKEPKENPYRHGSDEWKSWNKGWNEWIDKV